MRLPVSLLLVDDDAVFSRVMGDELSRLGFEVATAGGGEEAIQKAIRLEPSIVLLDLRLPDMDGLEVLRALRNKSPGSEVIMLTGHGSIDTAIDSVRMGAFDYLVKPCPLSELEVRIQKALERQYLRRRASLLERGLTPPGSRAAPSSATSPAFRQLSLLIDRAAASDSTVLITGETGSGKEMVAKLLHARGPRKTGRSSSSSARPYRRVCSRASCSATSVGPLRVPTARNPASSRWPTGAPSSWTRSAR